MKDCPKPGCHRPIASTEYACKDHWFQLPLKIRDAIWKAYRANDTKAYGLASIEAKKQWAGDK